MKNKKGVVGLLTNPLVILGLLAIVGLAFFGGDLLAIGADDFLIEDDFTTTSPALASKQCTTDRSNRFQPITTCNDGVWESKMGSLTNPSASCPGSSSSSVSVSGNNLNLNSAGGTTAEVKYLKDLKPRDIKFSATFNAGTSAFSKHGSSFDVFLGSQKLYSDSISNFAFSKFGQSQSKDYLFVLQKDIVDPELFLVMVNGKVVNKVKITESTAQLRIKSTSGGSPCGQSPTMGTATFKIDALKSRPYFNCQVDSDEIVVRDAFKEGTTFSIDDLNLRPVKFCVDNYPAIKRSLVNKGARADIQGQLTKKLTKGESITVGKGEVIEIYYIADFKEGLGTRCSLDSAWDTDLKKCVKIIDEQEDIVTFVNTKEIIKLASNQVFFKNSLKVADKSISSSKPKYVCSDVRADTAVVSDNKCWTNVIGYGGNNFNYIYAQEKNINKFLKLKWIPEAKFKEKKVQPGYVNNFVLTVDNEEILDVSTIPEASSKYWVIFKDNRNINFQVTNNLGKFDKSGIQVRETKRLLTSQKTEIKTIIFDKGTKAYSVPIDSSQLGRVEYEILFWYEVGGEKIFDDEKILRSFEVVKQIPKDIKVVEKKVTVTETITKTVTKTVEKNVITDFFKSIIDFFKNLFS
tara:strand:- start:748 stop:2643 length:1896 start_codon:yes stop_codon:yes gene_type:complete